MKDLVNEGRHLQDNFKNKLKESPMSDKDIDNLAEPLNSTVPPNTQTTYGKTGLVIGNYYYADKSKRKKYKLIAIHEDGKWAYMSFNDKDDLEDGGIITTVNVIKKANDIK